MTSSDLPCLQFFCLAWNVFIDKRCLDQTKSDCEYPAMYKESYRGAGSCHQHPAYVDLPPFKTPIDRAETLLSPCKQLPYASVGSIPCTDLSSVGRHEVGPLHREVTGETESIKTDVTLSSYGYKESSSTVSRRVSLTEIDLNNFAVAGCFLILSYFYL